MKKVFLCFIFIFLFTYNINIVNADTYTCAYKFSYKTGSLELFEKNDSLQFTIDTSNKTITYPDDWFDFPVYFLDYYIDNTFTTEYIVESLNGGCANTVVIGGLVFDYISAYAIIFEESNLYRLEEASELAGGGYQVPADFISETGMLVKMANASIGKYDATSSTGKVVETKFGCTYYDTVMGKLQELKCKSTNVECNLDDINDYNSKKTKLKSFCNKVLKFANYETSYCLKSCLKLSGEITELENFSPRGKCGLSEKLILWIANIIRWVKYIIPVAVIVLGILDFMKAIGADKEDEMKKAQQRFIKRLIAAALIFIIPFIIEFVLNKMGFDANGCGIINL